MLKKQKNSYIAQITNVRFLFFKKRTHLKGVTVFAMNIGLLM